MRPIPATPLDMSLDPTTSHCDVTPAASGARAWRLARAGRLVLGVAINVGGLAILVLEQGRPLV